MENRTNKKIHFDKQEEKIIKRISITTNLIQLNEKQIIKISKLLGEELISLVEDSYDDKNIDETL